MKQAELTEDQRRRFIDARQVFDAWREAARAFRHGYRGSMRWKHIKSAKESKKEGKDYLYRVYGRAEHSLGPRSPRTERIKADYAEQRTRLRRRVAALDKNLKEMQPLNRAAGLGRVPEIAARILRKLDAEGLLGTHLFVVGTHALYAYEAAAGVFFETGLTATDDIDLLWDARRRLSLALVDVREQGVLGLLKRVDRSFSAQPHGFRATNDDGYDVDLIRPFEKNEAARKIRKMGAGGSDLEAAAITGLQWLINAPKFEQAAMGTDGRPLWISCIDPRVFALHKYWMSRRADREAIKRTRDAQQARAVADIARRYLGLEFDTKSLAALPAELMAGVAELGAPGRRKSR